MSSQFDYRATPPRPAAEVFAAMVDADCLRARLAALGGRNAALLEHAADAGGTRFRVQHSLEPDDMPQAVRSFLPAEASSSAGWRRGGGPTTASTPAWPTSRCPGTPTSRPPGRWGCATRARAASCASARSVTVRVPLLEGRCEGSGLGEQILKLLNAEINVQRSTG